MPEYSPWCGRCQSWHYGNCQGIELPFKWIAIWFIIGMAFGALWDGWAKVLWKLLTS
jgi:hypothetical protein